MNEIIFFVFLFLILLGMGYFLYSFSEWFYDVYLSEDEDDGLS